MNQPPTIRIAYADDHVLVRKGIISLLAQYAHLSFEIEADNGKDLLQQIAKATDKPDICLLDINMPVMNGFDTLTELKKKWPEIGVLVLTVSDMEVYILRMILNGANGYLLKTCSAIEIVKAINCVYDGGTYFSEIVSRQYFHAVQNKQIKLPHLTEHEIAVMKKCCTDYSYAEIAKQLGTTTRSVEGHRDSMFRKLNVNSRVSLALYAIQIGLVSIEKPLINGRRILEEK